MAAEVVIPRRRDDADESIGSFIARRFGREAVEYLAEPLLAGIHAGDVDRLSMRALFPRFVEAERAGGSLLRAFRRAGAAAGQDDTVGRVFSDPPQPGRKAPRLPPHEGAFLSLPGGLTEMTCALVAALPPGSIRLGARVRRVSALAESAGPAVAARPAGFRIEAGAGGPIGASALVLATPAYVTAQLVGAIDADLARLCSEIPYASTATIALAFDRAAVRHPLNGSGFVVPRSEGTGILAASWLSSKWPDRAPEGRVLLRAFVGGARDPHGLERSDSELVDLAMGALRPVLSIEDNPLLTRVYRWESANAQHEVGHLDRLAAIDRSLTALPGLFFTGSGFRGVGIPDCVADGRATARKVAEWLSAQRGR
jgi:oxygen-dependent protoporphyrinogen oxidase